MSNRLKIGDRVLVTAGTHKGKTGLIDTRRSTAWVVVFDGGGYAQLASGQIKRVTT